MKTLYVYKVRNGKHYWTWLPLDLPLIIETNSLDVVVQAIDILNEIE